MIGHIAHVGPHEEEGEGGVALPILLAVVVVGLVVWMVTRGHSPPEEYVEKCKPFHYVKHERMAHGLVRVTCMNKRGAESTEMVEIDE